MAAHRESASDASTRSLASELPTGRSARLFARMQEILAAVVPGQPNQRLIAAATEALRDPDQARRQRDMVLLLDLLRPEDALAMHEAFAALHREGLAFAREYASFATRWGEVDARGALDYLGGDDPSRIPARDFTSIAYGWGKSDPKAALAWMENHAALADQRSGWFTTFNGWLETDARAATAAMFQHPLSAEETAGLVSRAARLQLFHAGLQETVAWLAAFPEDETFGDAARQAWDTTVPAFEELPYRDAAEAWIRVAERNWMDFGHFKKFAATVGGGRSKNQGEAGFYDAVGSAMSQDKISATVSRWLTTDPGPVLTWMHNLPAGPFASVVEDAARAAGHTVSE